MAGIAAQIAAMRSAFPAMRLFAEGRWGCAWEGPLVGLGRPYIVRVTHTVSATLGRCDLGWRSIIPRAQVISPDLVAECGGRPPHVYGIKPHPDLCVFDPHAPHREWRAGMLIAESYVLWVARWLASYELWTVTGKWSGPERHPAPKDAAATAPCPPAIPATAASPAAIGRVAEAEGTEGSGPILRAATEGRLPSLLLDW